MFLRSGRMEYRREAARRSCIDLECIDKEQFRSHAEIQVHHPNSVSRPLRLPGQRRFQLEGAYSVSAKIKLRTTCKVHPPARCLSPAATVTPRLAVRCFATSFPGARRSLKVRAMKSRTGHT